jgi:hypothetical protein
LYTRKNPETGRSYGATEPGWDKHAPERPALISAWIKHVTGTLVPEAVSMVANTFPPDLLASVLNEQRNSSGDTRGTTARSEGIGDVVKLSDRIASRNPEERQLRLLLPSVDTDGLALATTQPGVGL